MDDHLRFLDLIRRELACEDARFQLGGRPTDDGRELWAELGEAWRLVARFGRPPKGGVREALVAKLEALAASFTGLGAELRERVPAARVDSSRDEVDEALTLLAAQAKALRAVVLDEDSPVMWGSSELPKGAEDVEFALGTGELADSAAAVGLDLVALLTLSPEQLEQALAALDSGKLRQRMLRKLPQIRELGAQRDAASWAAHIATCRAIAALRRAPERREAMTPELGWFAREFAGIYHVLLVYAGPFSELDATRPMRKALPVIERLVLALPPVEPPPKSNLRVLRPR